MDIRLCDDGNVDVALDILKRHKVGVEIQAFHDPFLKNKKKEINRCKEAYLKVKHKSLHAPFWDLNVGTKMPGLRKETLKYFNEAYKVAQELGCDSIVVHNGYIPGTYYKTAWVSRAMLFWKDFFADKGDSIAVMIENQFELDSEMMKQEIDAVNDKRLKVCLDIGHAHCNSDMSVYDWIKTLGNRIGYMHLHNNHGKNNKAATNTDEHNGFDNGTIDFKKVVKSVKKYCPKAILAVESHLKDIEKTVDFLEKNAK